MSIWEIFTVLGGLGLFLYGMHIMSDGLEDAAGDRMRSILEKATSNRVLGVLVGMLVTMLVQSSSATTVMVVGFVNAGLMNLVQAIGVIMGANIGTTITAQLIAFKIDSVAPLIIFAGVLLWMFFKNKTAKKVGYILLGFGILFFGISMMSGPLKQLSALPAFQQALLVVSNPLLAVLAGMAVTMVIQSSSATTGIIIALYMSGADIPFRTAAFLILGTNIGTCITALLASLASGRDSKRAALCHVLFNVIGTVVFGTAIMLFPGILRGIQQIAPGDLPRQVAMFHTIFNVSMVLVMLPFVRQLAALVQWILPERPAETAAARRLLYLDSNIMKNPSIAVTQAHREVSRMARLTRDNLQLSIDAFHQKDHTKADEVMENEKTINFLNHQITSWLVRMRGLDLSAGDLSRLGMMLHTVSDLERVGDHAVNIAEYAVMESENAAKITPSGIEELVEMGKQAMEVFSLAVEIFETRDTQRLPQVDPLEQRVDDTAAACIDHHIQRLISEICDPRGGVVFTDMVNDLERCADHGTNVAYSILGETVWDPENKKLQVIG